MGTELNPYIKPYVDKLSGYTPGLGFAGKEAKRFLKKFRTGNFDEYLAPEMARGAVRKQEIEQGYGMGSAALATANGDAAQFQALKDRALAASDQQTGMEAIEKQDRLYNTALATGQAAYDSKRNAELSKYQTILNAINSGTYKTQNPIWGLLGAGIGAAGSIFQGALKV